MSFPKGKTSVTCYTYEPWHYRYVGRTRAAKIRASGLTLRQFLWREQNTPAPTPTPRPTPTPDAPPDAHADASARPRPTPAPTPVPTPDPDADPDPHAGADDPR